MGEVVRVAQIVGNANAGGVESVIMNLYKNIDKTKYQFDFFVEQTCPIINKELIESLGGKVVIIPSYKNLNKYIKTLTKLFKEGNYKIVHSNMNTISYFTLKAAKKAGVKIRISHAHSTASKKEILRSLFKYLLRPLSKVNANYYWACSDVVGKWQFGKKAFENNKVSIIKNAIDVNKFVFDESIRKEYRKKYNIADDDFLIGHVGRFVTVKNHTFLLKVFNEVLKIKPDSKLLLVGDGPLKEEITNQSKNLGIDKNIIFVGLTDNPAPYYSMMDVFVMPSLYEGFPVVGVEAQVNGLPVIFSDNVPKEAKISDFTSFESLNNSATIWSKKIMGLSYEYNRKQVNEKYIKTDFNIAFNATNVTNLYDQYLKEQYPNE